MSLVQNAWVTFDSEFGEFRDRLEELRYEIEGEIRLASDRASSKERETQGSHRRDIVLFTRRNDSAMANVRKQELRRLAQEKRKCQKRSDLERSGPNKSQEPNAIVCWRSYWTMTKTLPTVRRPRNVVLVPDNGFSPIRICNTGRLQQALAHFG
jgi:hypothetical protein